MPHSLSRCHLGARRKGRAWEYVPPGEWMGVLSPLSALTHGETASFTTQQSPGFTRGQGSPTAGPSVLGPCLQARQGRNGGTTPIPHRHLGERNLSQPLPETTSACMEGETKSVSSSQGQDHGRFCSAFGFFFKCRFFITEKVSLPLKRRRPGQKGPTGYVGQSKNPEKEEWMYSVE